MKTLQQLLTESKFTNWVRPTTQDLKREYHVEFELKGLGNSLPGGGWETVEDFVDAVKNAKVVEVTPSMDQKIAYRSRTKSFDSLLSLIKGYQSYPKYRNEETLQAIYDGFKNNNKMVMPLLLKFPDGKMRVMAGNTRMDIAFQLGINPKVLLIST